MRPHLGYSPVLPEFNPNEGRGNFGLGSVKGRAVVGHGGPVPRDIRWSDIALRQRLELVQR